MLWSGSPAERSLVLMASRGPLSRPVVVVGQPPRALFLAAMALLSLSVKPRAANALPLEFLSL